MEIILSKMWKTKLVQSKYTRKITCSQNFIFFACAFSNSSSGQLAFQGDPYQGISSSSFSEDVNKVLLSAVDESNIEIKPDGEGSVN